MHFFVREKPCGFIILRFLRVHGIERESRIFRGAFEVFEVLEAVGCFKPRARHKEEL